MGRVHLFEFEDQRWFPRFIRNYGTDFLQFLANKTRMFAPVAPLIGQALEHSKEVRIIDLCSGGGGGLLSMSEDLLKNKPNLKIILTDKYPNEQAFNYTQKQSNAFEAIMESVDAMNVDRHLNGVRTLFLSLHHFKPEEARQIVKSTIESGNPIAVFEGQERSVTSLLAMFFSPITVLLTTFFIRPFRVGRILFTYLIPIVPLFVWWDGIVSALRTYSVREMNQLISEVPDHESYKWKIGKVQSGPSKILYLVGYSPD